jgi:hypothetical protein
VRELLSVIEIWKEYKNILLGYHQFNIVFTDQKDNNFNGLRLNALACILRWLLLLEEYGATFEYLPGSQRKNIVLNA